MTWSDVLFESLYSSASRNGVYKAKDFHGRGTRIVNMGELFGYSFISNQEMKRVELDERELDLNSLEDGDLLFGRRSLVESGAGKCSLVVNPLEPMTFESSIIRVRVNKEVVNPRFLYYYFLSPQGRGRIRSIVSGTNVKGIRSSDLKKISVANPLKVVQDGIVAALSAYDDLIDNNRRRIALLEESARQLYHEWFVRLRYPGHEHTPIVDGVPQGWERKSLGEVTNINQRNIANGFDGEIEYIDIASVTRNSVDSTTTYEFRDAPGRARRIVRHGDIIWSCVRPNRRSHAVIWQPAENLIASTGFVVLSPKTLPTSFLHQAVTTDAFVGYLENHAKGAAYPAVVSGDFERAMILVPSPALVTAFDDFAGALLWQTHNLQQQNQKLRQTRDLLLPRLMNGELAV
jgi:type I restriction enzyme S subunit